MFLRGLNKNWKNAYRAEAKFYSGNNNIFGVFPLTENTDTIFHSKPRAKVDDQEVKVWRILLVPIQGEPLGDRKSTRLNSSHIEESRMPSSA